MLPGQGCYDGVNFPKTPFAIDLLRNNCYNKGTNIVQEEIPMKNVIATTNAPGAIGPYSQAIETESFVFTSGQLGIDPATGDFAPGGIQAQTRQALLNVQAILAQAGLTMDNVVKATVFMKNMDDFAAMNEVYATFFTSNPPARSAFQVGKLPKDGMVEIETIAVK